MNFVFITVSYKDICKLIEIKYFDKLTFQDIHYTVSRECNLRNPFFLTSNGLPIKDNFLPDYVQNFAQDSSFVLFVDEHSTVEEPILNPIIVNSFPIQKIQPPPATNLNYIPEENLPQNDFHSKEDLLNFFKSNPVCCIILASYKNTNQLTNSDRTKMCKSIVQHLLFNHPNRILTRNDLNNIILLIIELFPDEKRETYLNKTSRTMIGKLHDAYNNYRGILAKQGIIKRRSKQQPGEKLNTENLQTDDTTTMSSNSILIVNEPLNSNIQTNITKTVKRNEDIVEISIQDIENGYLNNIELIKELKKLLISNNITKEIIRKYDEKKDLQYSDKIEISKELIKYLIDSKRILTSKDFENLSKMITEIFPNEKSEFYYYQFSATSKNGSGILIDAYNYIKSITEKSAHNQSQNQQKTKTSSETNDVQIIANVDKSSLSMAEIKLEKYEMLENQQHRYFNFDDISRQSNENFTQNSQLSNPATLKRKNIENGDEQLQKRQKSIIPSDREGSSKLTENIQNFMDKFYIMQKELFNSFFEKQQKLMEETHEFQRKQNENILKKFETQTNRILDNINMIFEKKCSSTSVTTTSTTDEF